MCWEIIRNSRTFVAIYRLCKFPKNKFFQRSSLSFKIELKEFMGMTIEFDSDGFFELLRD